MNFDSSFLFSQGHFNVKFFEMNQTTKPLEKSGDENPWVDYGNYFMSNIPQSDPQWKELRHHRLTASNFGTAAGRSAFKTPEELSLIIKGEKEETFSPESLKAMEHGTLTEPEARKWYEEKYKCLVREVGLAIPKWDFRIGASLDGEVICSDGNSDGNIEIKCPKKMYSILIEFRKALDLNWTPPRFFNDHIFRTHYDQMQGGLAITRKKWCDYIVYCKEENDIFVWRVEWNPDHWNQLLYPRICQFFSTYGLNSINNISIKDDNRIKKRIDPF